MYKAYKYRIYPNKEQKEFFSKCFRAAIFIYNKMLYDRIQHYKKTGENLYTIPSQYKKNHPWLKEVDSLALGNAYLNLNRAYNNYFRNKYFGFPRFKNKKSKRLSYTTYNYKNLIRIENSYIRLPKLKAMVKIVQHRTFDGKIKSCTITQVPSEKYFINIVVETEINKLAKVDNKVGIDLGLKDFAVCSNKETFTNPKHFEKSEQKIKKLQKNLSRKRRGSKNRDKARIKLAKQYEKISNQRKNFLHETSTKLIKENQTIVIEDLGIKNLIKNKNNAKLIANASWSEFRSLLTYKAKWYGRNLIVAPNNYASSQLCSQCGNQSDQTNDLSIRTYVCQKCNLIIDRDYNASLNLLKLASDK